MADFRNIRKIFNAPPKASPKVNPGPGGGNSAVLRTPRPANPSIPSQAKGLGEDGGCCCSKALERTKKPEELISAYDHGVMHHDVGAGKVRKNTYVFQGAFADAASPRSAIPKTPEPPAVKQPKRPSARHNSPCPVPPEPTSQRAWRPGAGQAPLVKRPSPSSPCPPEVARTSSESPTAGSRGEGTPQRRMLPSKAQLGPPPAKPPRPPGGLKHPVSPVVHVPVSALPPRQEAAVEDSELPPNDEDIYDDVVPKGHEEEKEDNEVVPSDKYFRGREGSGDYDDIVTPSRGPAMCGDSKDSTRGQPAHRESGKYDDVMLPESTGSTDNNDGYFTVGADCNEEIYDDIDNYCSTEESDSHPDCGMMYWPDGAGADAHAPTNSAHSQGARDKPMADWRKAKERQLDKRSKTGNKELLQLQKKFNVHLSEDSPVMCCTEVIQPKSRALKKLELAVAITDTIEILHFTDEYAICRNQHGKYGYVHTCQLHMSNVQEFESSELYADVGTSCTYYSLHIKNPY
ncbi:uncharacterized protein LOC116948876 isoform X2 [Petromyzon marinus]|uniref:Uncharacterized protein LOC116948876 isoform X2 n=1 Tax=Petromyzon marinus TaxID=7757 RepID=A0AAJ7TPW8_PETMA|nr:uncharacterized protein LOC116948876 isoform X2 [Petromyzon marinus]